MPQIICPGCGSKHGVPDQERAFRCPTCGTRAMVASLVRSAGTSEPTGKPEPSGLAAGPEDDSDWGVPAGKVACDWCAMFVSIGPMCEVCGSPISKKPPSAAGAGPTAPEPLPVPEAFRVTVEAAGLEGHEVVVLTACRRCGKPTDRALCPACEALYEELRTIKERDPGAGHGRPAPSEESAGGP